VADGFVVDLDQLRRHSQTTEELGGRSDVAADASGQVADMDQAYGLLCRPIGWMLKGPQDRCAEAIAMTAHALHEAGRRLGECADAYQEVNDAVAEELAAMMQKLVAVSKAPTVGGR
jgi:hypothetical protein